MNAAATLRRSMVDTIESFGGFLGIGERPIPP